MLGFGPISSAPISGSPFRLVAVPTAMAATIAFTFDATPRAGIFTRMQANIGIALDISARLFVNQAISGTATLTFGGTPTLRLAGKPLVLRAIPVSFTLRAPPDSYSIKAGHQSFTVRGAR